MKSIRLNVAHLLKQRGMTQSDLMHELRVSYVTAHKLSTGNMTAITFNVLARLCTALAVTPNDILKLESVRTRKAPQ